MPRSRGRQLIAFQGALPPEGKGADFGRNELVNIYVRATGPPSSNIRLEWRWKWSLRHFRRGGSSWMGGPAVGSFSRGNELASSVLLTGTGVAVDFFVHQAPTTIEFGTVYQPTQGQAVIDTARFLRGINESTFRQEAVLKSIETSSKRLGNLTWVLVGLTVVLSAATIVSILVALGVR